MMALAEKVRAMTASSSEIVLIPYDQAYEAGFEDMPRRVPDLRKIDALIGEPKAIGQVFNIGNGEEISMRALAEKVKTMTASASEIVTIPYDQAYEAGFEDMPRRVPDISKIRGLVGYDPKVQLDEILTRVIDYVRTR